MQGCAELVVKQPEACCTVSAGLFHLSGTLLHGGFCSRLFGGSGLLHGGLLSRFFSGSRRFLNNGLSAAGY
jgi:hypothetical protein